MSEELRNALEAAIETHSELEPANEAQAAPEVQDSDPSPQPAETESAAAPAVPEGEGDADAAPAEKADSGEPAKVPADGQAEQQSRQHRVDRPPQSWKKEAKGEWNALPLHVRQEIYRREMQVEKTLQESAPARQLAQEFQQTVAPYMARIQSMGATPVQAVQNLLQADYLLATATPTQAAQFMAKLIKDYEVDITALDNALVGSMTPQNPQAELEQRILQRVQEQLAPALSLAQQQQQQMAMRAQQEQQLAVQTVEQMALDPRFPYFEDVRGDMADIIELGAKRGIAITPEQAYHKAVAFNPTTSQEIQRQGMVGQATQQHQQAQRAKAAASSVTGAPAGGGTGSFQSDGSLRGAIEAAFGGQRL